MKKNIIIGVLSAALLLIIAVGWTFLSRSQQELSMLYSQVKTAQQNTKSSNSDNQVLEKDNATLSQEKTNETVQSLNTAVNGLYNDYLTFKQQDNSEKSRKADAAKYATPAVVNILFPGTQASAGGEATGYLVSEVQNINVYVANANDSVISAIVAYDVNVKIGNLVQSPICLISYNTEICLYNMRFYVKISA